MKNKKMNLKYIAKYLLTQYKALCNIFLLFVIFTKYFTDNSLVYFLSV